MGSGGGGNTSTNQTSTASIAPQLQPLFSQTGQMITDIQGQMPGFGQFFGAQPQYIPGLTPGQQQVSDVQGERAFGAPLTGWEYGAGSLAQGLTGMNQLEQGAQRTLGRQEVGGYGNEELGAINRLWGNDILAGGYNPAEQQALGQINQFAGGEIGQSPATQAAMQAVRTPVLNELAQAGLGNSDAVGAALGAQYAPILAQELQTRASVIPQLANMGQNQRAGTLAATGQLSQMGQAMRQGLLSSAQQQGQLGQQLRGGQTAGAQLLQALGGTEAGRQSTLLSEYNTAQEQARQVQAQQAEAQFNDFLRRQGLGQSFTTGILSGFPNIGTGQTTVSSTKGGGGK